MLPAGAEFSQSVIRKDRQTYEANTRFFLFCERVQKFFRELTDSSYRTASPFVLLAQLWNYNNCPSLTCTMAIVLSRALSLAIHFSSFLCKLVIGAQRSINPAVVFQSSYSVLQSEAAGVLRADREFPGLNKLFPAYYLMVFHVECHKRVISVLTGYPLLR